MAELTERAAMAASGGDRADGTGPPGDETAGAPVADPRAVRVRLAPAFRFHDEPALRVGPVADALHMTNPTVGLGPLGGVVLPEVASADAPAVLAQRQAVVDGVRTDARLHPGARGRHVLDAGGVRTPVILEPSRPGVGGATVREVLVAGFRFEVEVEPERIAALRERAGRGRASSVHSGPLEVKAIIPGKVVSVSVAPGDAVTAGQQLLAVEAMKMQNELRAPRDGTIERVGVAPGVNIEVGDLLVVIS
jgi:biotin carboxyl carrier protein